MYASHLDGAIAAPARAPIMNPTGAGLVTPGATPWGYVPPKPMIQYAPAPPKPVAPIQQITLTMPVLKPPMVTPTPAPVIPVLKPSILVGTTKPPVTVPASAVTVNTLPVGDSAVTNLASPLSMLNDMSPNTLMFLGLAALVVFMESRKKGR